VALATMWSSMVNDESTIFIRHSKPAEAAEYVRFANDAAESSILWRIMYRTATMQAHLKQRMQQAAAYQATLPTDGELRTKMREDYVNNAKTLHLDSAMTAAMLALIDDANARHDGIPITVTVKTQAATEGDSDLQLLLGTNTGGPDWFHLDSGCIWDNRLHDEHLPFTSVGLSQHGVAVEVTLKDLPGMMELTDASTGAPEQKVRRFAATVDVTVTPPHGNPVRATREERLNHFSFETKVKVDRMSRQRVDGPISMYEIYNEAIRTLAGNACYGGARLLGTTEVP
jgi:hypothetical protein